MNWKAKQVPEEETLCEYSKEYQDVTLKLCNGTQVEVHKEYFWCEVCEYIIARKSKYGVHMERHQEYKDVTLKFYGGK